MTTFPDLDHFLADTRGDALTLPVRGKSFEFSGRLSIEDGLLITRLREEARRLAVAERDGQLDEYQVREANREALDDESESALYMRLIGDQLDALKVHGVSWDELAHIGWTLLSWHMLGVEHALKVWTGGQAGPAGGGARPPARSASSPQRTSRSGSTRRTSPAPKPRRSGGGTSSARGGRSKPTSTGSTGST